MKITTGVSAGWYAGAMVLGFLLGSFFSYVYLHAGLLYELRVAQSNDSTHMPLTGLMVRIAQYAGETILLFCHFMF